MIRLGVKVAANSGDVERLEKSGASCCEVRFILENASQFKPILKYTHKHNIQTNFHHWAAFDGIMANPAAPGKFGEEVGPDY